jgi:hypothetical protein
MSCAPTQIPRDGAIELPVEAPPQADGEELLMHLEPD